jgi:TetR/AcrR family transcriptional repressor of nem operon
MARQSNTREQIVDRARDLLQTRGFDGFSYKDISTHLGIRNAAVHYHFPAKVDLGLELIEEFTAEVRAKIEFARAENVPLKQQLDTYFHQVDEELCQKHWSVCPMGAFSTSFDNISEPMQQAAKRLSGVLHDWMRDLLQSGRASGEFRFAGDPDDKAMEITCAIQGARQLSRVRGENIVALVAEQISKDLYQ